MGTGRAKDCGDCQRLQAQVEALESLVVSLRAEVTLLREQLAAARQGSSTSSKPPSSDIVKPPKPVPPPGQAKRLRSSRPCRWRQMRPGQGAAAGDCRSRP